MGGLEEHWFKVGVLVALLLFAASPAYYFIVYIPHRDAEQHQAAAAEQQAEAAQTALEKQNLDQQKAAQSDLFQTCLDTAHQHYLDSWSSDCTLEGKPKTCTS